MKHSPWRFAPYALVAAGALAGQISAGHGYFKPTVWGVYIVIAVCGLAIEGGAVWMGYLAKQRGEMGENSTPFFVISTLFAALAVAINVIGHWGNIWAVAMFGGLSAAGYAIWCFDLRALLEDSWDKDGSIRRRAPSRMILMRFSEGDAKVAARARTIALIHAEANRDAPALGPSQAIALARRELDEEARRAGIAAAVQQHMKEEMKASDIDIKLAMLSYGAQAIADEMMQRAKNGDMAEALSSRITPKRLTGIDPNKTAGNRAQRPAPANQDGKPPVIEGDFEEVQEKPRKALPSGSRGQDPWEKFAPLLKAIMENNPDWNTRETGLTTSQIEGALAWAVANAGLDKALVPTSKPYLLKLRWMIEALSQRPVPDEQWEKSLAGVDRDRIDEQRAALGVTG